MTTPDDRPAPHAGARSVDPVEHEPTLIELLSLVYPDDAPTAG